MKNIVINIFNVVCSCCYPAVHRKRGKTPNFKLKYNSFQHAAFCEILQNLDIRAVLLYLIDAQFLATI